MQGQVGEWALSGRRGRDTLSPVELATELTARISSGALLSEYSTNTSSSFRAVFTTKRDWGEGSARMSGAWARLVPAPGGEG